MRRFRSARFGHYKKSGNRGKNFNKGTLIDPKMFVNKAVEDLAEDTFVPENSFSDFAFSDEIKQSIVSRGYITPTPIQDKCIPALLEGKDVVGIANTGTGKTAAFLLPLINKVFNKKSENVLIIAPTRELALQINEEFKSFASKLKLHSVVCIGGTSLHRQIADLKRRPHFVIGTPGRLRDLENRGALKFHEFNSIVLDEVDRMLDMGFLPEMKYVVSKLPNERHSLFFSATLPDKLKSLVNTFVRDPLTVSVKSRSTSKNVDQDIVKMEGRLKTEVLQELLADQEFKKVLVFGRTKHGIEKLKKKLSQNGFKVDSIHGNKSQSQRQRALANFKTDKVSVLLATDIAARGLDISDVSHVINYDVPESVEDYVHRIGRTGRAGKKGKALTFIN